jgi:molecular chaperone Hsp33
VLPFCSDETLDQLEKNLLSMPSATELLNAGLSPQQITDRILQDIGAAKQQSEMTPR